MNVLHSSMEITDEFYSNLNDKEIQDRISRLGNNTEQNGVSLENIDALISVLESLKTRGKLAARSRKSEREARRKREP